jgi:hypothetical protein
MRFHDRPGGTCEVVYTYAISLRPRWIAALLDPVAGLLFARETRLRFSAMARYLATTCH